MLVYVLAPFPLKGKLWILCSAIGNYKTTYPRLVSHRPTLSFLFSPQSFLLQYFPLPKRKVLLHGKISLIHWFVLYVVINQVRNWRNRSRWRKEIYHCRSVLEERIQALGKSFFVKIDRCERVDSNFAYSLIGRTQKHRMPSTLPPALPSCSSSLSL